MAMIRFGDEPEEKSIEKVVDEYSEFIKSREAKTFIEAWSKKKKLKKVGIAELLFVLYNAEGVKKGKKGVLSRASEILGKLTGEGEWFSFLSALKLSPEKKMK